MISLSFKKWLHSTHVWLFYFVNFAICFLIAQSATRLFFVDYLNGLLKLTILPTTTWQLSVQTFQLTDPDLRYAESIRFHLGYEMAVNFIPDYKPELFQCARISNMSSLSSAIYEFRNGQPWLKKELKSENNDNANFEISFSPNVFPAPEKSLDIVFYPPMVRSNVSIEDMKIKFVDGSIRRYSLRQQNNIIYLIGSIPLFLLLLWLDHRNFSQIKLIKNRIRYRLRLLSFRVLGVVYIGFLTLTIKRGIGEEQQEIFSILFLCLLWTIIGGGLRIFRKNYRKIIIGKKEFISKMIVIILIPWIVASFFIFGQKGSGYLMQEMNYFHNQIVMRKGEEPIVLFMGGSSTEGEDYYDSTRFDIPALLQDKMRVKYPDIKIANAGVVATTTDYVLKYLPALLILYFSIICITINPWFGGRSLRIVSGTVMKIK